GRREVAQIACRPPGPNLCRRHYLTGRQQCASRQHSRGSDPGAVHDDRTHTDEGALLDDTAVENGHVPDQGVLADQRGQARIASLTVLDVDYGSVLHVAARADDNTVEITAQHAVVPDARAWPHLDVTDQPRARRDEGRFVNPRRLAAMREDGRAGMVRHDPRPNVSGGCA